MAKEHPVWDNKDLIVNAVTTASSVKEALSSLGVKHSSGNYQTLKSRCIKFNLEYPIMNPSERTRQASSNITLSPEVMFSNRGVRVNGSRLKDLMVSWYGIEEKCLICGQLPIWQGKPLTLEVDHIDGNSFNNTIENLRIICGHCHSQTENFRGRNKNSEIYNYCKCGKKISKGARSCVPCSHSKSREIHSDTPMNPSLEELRLLYQELGSFEAIGRKIGVSSNAIRRRLKRRKLTTKDVTG